MGLPMVPPVLGTPNVTNMTKGLNFASAGAGILPESGSDLVSSNEILFCFKLNLVAKHKDNLFNKYIYKSSMVNLQDY